MIPYIYLLQHSVENSARKFPDRPAFRCMDQEVSYSELQKKANQVAHMLHERGLSKGDRVGILMNRTIETSYAIYGVLQAGGVYVALNSKLPTDKLNYLIDDCGINILLTTSKLSRVTEVLNLGNEKVICLDTCNWKQPTNFKCPFLMVETDPAYILYTSGSTGNPKGIMHSHSSGLAYAKLSATTFGVTEYDRIANHAPIFFDISTFGYLTGPYAGACTVIISDPHVIMAPSLANLIAEEKISIWYSVPLALIQLYNTGLLEKLDFSHLRLIKYGGEVFNIIYLAKMMELWSHADFYNIYGPTETNQCTHYHIPSPPEEDDEIPIGQVWGNTDFRVVEGELVIKSATRMLGYWNNDQLTRVSIHQVDTGFGKLDEYYKTGDLVREGSNGFLYLIGRKDYQIKYRGFRLELGDIENAFLSHTRVEEAIALPIKDQHEIKEIHLVARLNDSVEPQELKNHSRAHLPVYAIPTEIHILEDLPRTSTGKVDRNKIAELITKA